MVLAIEIDRRWCKLQERCQLFTESREAARRGSVGKNRALLLKIPRRSIRVVPLRSMRQRYRPCVMAPRTRMNGPVHRVGILTGGGDAPGLNAVIRAVVRAAAPLGITCIGLADGFDGLRDPARARTLTRTDVAGIHRLGGTILGTINHGCPLGAPGAMTVEGQEYARRCVDGFARLDLQALVVVGGDGTLAIAQALSSRGVPIVGVPKTIDNDIVGTDMTFGFDSAVSFATEAIDRVHSTADAHHRVMVVEVMGRYAGWIALHAAVAGGADVALIPEIPFCFERVAECIRQRDAMGATCSIVVAAEGAVPSGGRRSVVTAGTERRLERLGGIGATVAEQIQRRTKHEARHDVLGHLQRGGSPSSADRVLAARFGAFAVDRVRAGEFGVMAASCGGRLRTVPLAHTAGKTRAVARGDALVKTARSIGIAFGD
jgi:ATP-dependent phosphofructokinase / diphosphate-dependent phosphofructokinase